MRSPSVLAAALFLACSGPSKPTVAVPAPTTPTPTAPVVVAPPTTQPGVRLPRTFLPTQYAARLAIDPAQTTFTGSIQITGTVSAETDVVWLHGHELTIRKAVAQQNGTTVALTVTPRGTELLEIRAATPLAPGAWTLAFDYAGKLDGVNTTGAFRSVVGEHAYVYTQLEAVYARRVFPCFDEPDNKVPWKLTLDVPKSQVAVSNAPQASETPLDDRTKRVEFAITKPLPTYLVAFGVGPFDIVDGGKTKRGTPVRMITLARRAPDAAFAAQTTVKMLEVTEEWFGMPYPYEKLDMLTIPLTVGFGAMENAGLVTFTEHLMLHDPVKSGQSSRRSWIVVGAHEIAHQWFGNLVTPGFWDDIWLNEGFANWLEYKISAKVDPAYRDEESAVHTRNEALSADALVSARRVRQPITSNDDIFNAFDRITYDKGASVLAMFESYLGAELFQQGVRDYLAARAWGNATSADFVAQIDKTAKAARGTTAADPGSKQTAPPKGKPPLDVVAAFGSFLDQPGAPKLTATTTCGRDGKATVALAQERYVPPGAPAPQATTPWIVPVCVAYDRGGARAEQCTVLSTPTGSLALDTARCPRWVMPNVDGRGYYRNAYTAKELVALRDEAWPKLQQSEKMALFFDVQTGAKTGKLPLQLALSFVPKILAIDDRHAVPPAAWFVESLSGFVPNELRPKYEHYLRTTFGPLATKSGLLAKPGESIDAEVIRRDTVYLVGKVGREPKLVEEAVKLADNWKELPQAIRGMVIAVAADANPALFDKLLTELVPTTDRHHRREIMNAVASVRDTTRQKAALSLMLDPKRDLRELLGMLDDGFVEANDDVARGFFREHAAKIVERLPSSGTSSAASWVSAVFTKTCRADQRAAVVDYVTKTFASMPGGEREVQQDIEAMDQCIAKRAILEPEIRAWLQGLRVPKPAKK